MSNHIDHIEITNFKSIRHAKIEGCKRINVFIGYPNVGKSNILEALSLFSLPYLKIAGSKKLTDFIRVKNIPELAYGTDIDNPISVSINDNLNIVGRIDLKSYYPLEWEYGVTEDIGSISLYDEQKILFNNELRGKFENLPKKIGGFGGFDILKYHFSVEHFKPKKTLYPSLLPPYGSNLFELINTNATLREFIKKEIAKIGGDYIYDSSDNTGKILMHNKEQTFTLPFTSMADTLQRLIFYKAAIATNNDAIILFEEPEAHMFPPYISKLVWDIISDINNGNQYFIATHSPFLINDLLEEVREDLSIYAVGYENGQTIIKKITEKELHEIYQYGIDLFFNLEDYLENA